MRVWEKRRALVHEIGSQHNIQIGIPTRRKEHHWRRWLEGLNSGQGESAGVVEVVERGEKKAWVGFMVISI